jgi:CheY-like chemotaxis protein
MQPMPLPRILIVDDYPDALEVWGLYLRAAGFQVLVACDGPHAFDDIVREKPDVVVMDLELPGKSGFEVASAVKARPDTCAIPLIAATGYSLTSQLDRALASGFDSVIVKPCDPKALVAEIHRILNAAAPAEPASQATPSAPTDRMTGKD